MSLAHPPTIIVVHPRENRKKCSVEPLRALLEFRFWTFPDKLPDDLARYVRLGIGGPILSAADAESGLLILDGTWRLAERMEKTFAALPVRSLPPVKTAYPRTSKIHNDPSEGLATIEAIYAAYRLLGRDTSNLLAGYHWAERFLELNPELG
jgi:pre-rRNA-processing protein TSR3